MSSPFTFYLGTHMPSWLRKTTVPLFVSRRRLSRIKRHKPATCRWALDSGGFSELSLYGRWETTPEQYVEEVRRWSSELGGMDWAAIQDWMCEPVMTKKTGLSVEEHQRRTIESWFTLTGLAPEVPWTPVIQGWQVEDYWNHVLAYEKAGVQLATLPTVGIGSVCRRQHTDEVVQLVSDLSSLGIRIHGFGFKTRGVSRARHSLVSADSMAWSYAARRQPEKDRCSQPKRPHKNCANCLDYALEWRENVLNKSRRGR